MITDASITAVATAVSDVAKAYQVWFQAQRPDVQQLSGDQMVAFAKWFDTFLATVRGEVPPANRSPRRVYGEPLRG